MFTTVRENSSYIDNMRKYYEKTALEEDQSWREEKAGTQRR
jgi:hypothetical protein